MPLTPSEKYLVNELNGYKRGRSMSRSTSRKRARSRSPSMLSSMTRSSKPSSSLRGSSILVDRATRVFKTKSGSKTTFKKRRLPKKLKVARSKKKKFSKTVANIVRNVTAKKANIGQYHKYAIHDCDLVPAVPTGNQARKFYLYADKKENTRDATYTEYSCSFTPFASKRILDAASVLYNAKAKGVTVENATNNFDFQKLKVNVPYYYHAITLKNFTNEPYDVNCWQFKALHNTDIHPISVFERDLLVPSWQGGVPPLTNDTNSFVYLPMGIKFGTGQSLRKHYSYKKVQTKKMLPGHEMKVIDMYRNTTVDFQTLGNDATPAVLCSYAKGSNIYIFEIIPTLQGISDGTRLVGRRKEGTPSAVDGWLIERTEHWTMEQPEITLDANQRDVHVNFDDSTSGAGYTNFVQKRSEPTETVLASGTS